MNNTFIESINKNLVANNGKLSFDFILSLVDKGTVQYLHPTPTMRLCIISLESGHEVLGKAQVLDASNDVEEIGNKVAYDNALSDIWVTIGSIAKVL